MIFITGTFSAYEPATPLMALNSPTPKVVIRAAIPFIRAYPSAAYAAFNSLQLPTHSNFSCATTSSKKPNYNHQGHQKYAQFLIRLVCLINMYLQYIAFSNESSPNCAMNISIDERSSNAFIKILITGLWYNLHTGENR